MIGFTNYAVQGPMSLSSKPLSASLTFLFFLTSGSYLGTEMLMYRCGRVYCCSVLLCGREANGWFRAGSTSPQPIAMLLLAQQDGASTKEPIQLLSPNDMDDDT